jgi:branched-chain amino acid transport system substrate-binding protein
MSMQRTFKRRAVAVLAAVAAAGALGACGTTSSSGDSGGSGGTAASGPIKLGYTATLTGDFASYGTEMRDGVKLAIEEINAAGGVDGHKLEMVSQDDLGKPSNGPVVAQKLCDDHGVSAVLGYSFSSVALAAVPVYTQCKLPVVASAVTSPELSGASPYFFRNVLSDASQGEQMGKYAVETLRRKRIAVLYQQDDYGKGASDGFVKGAEAAGGQIITRDAYQLQTSDFSSQIAKIKGKAVDALYIGGFYTEAAKIAKQARRAGLDVQLIGTDGVNSPDLFKLGGDAVEGMAAYAVFAPSIDDPKVQKFVGAYKAAYGEDPTNWAALAYDATYTVKAAIEKAGGASRADIAEGLHGLGYSGVTGDATLDDQGDREGSIRFLKVEGGKFATADAG